MDHKQNNPNHSPQENTLGAGQQKDSKTKTVENPDLLKSIAYLQHEQILPSKREAKLFQTVSEAEEDAIEEICSSIFSRTNELKQTMSDMRRHGTDLSIEGIKILEVPLKLRVWKSTYKESDLASVVNILRLCESYITDRRSERPLQKKEPNKSPDTSS